MAKDSKELTNWEDELASQAVTVSAKERPAVSQISLRGGIMTYESDAMPNNEMKCIVVNHCFENRWYEGAFDPDNIDLPRCFALALEKEELRPHENGRPPMIVPKEGEEGEPRLSTQCKGCPKNEWGSDPRPGSRGKACKEIRRLAVLPYTDTLNPDNVADTEMAVIKLPVTSVKNWSNYVNKVGASLKRPPWSVITLIKVVPDQKTQFKVLFDCVNAVEPAFLTPLNAKREAVMPALTAPYDAPSEGDSEPEEATTESTKY